MDVHQARVTKDLNAVTLTTTTTFIANACTNASASNGSATQRKPSIIGSSCIDLPISIDLTGQIRLNEGVHLATGGFGHIWCTQWIRDDGLEPVPVALKIMHGYGQQAHRAYRVIKVFEREFYVWKRLIHPNIAPLYGICTVDPPSCGVIGACNAPALVSPFYRNGNTLDYLQRCLEVDRLKMIVDIATGLAYLHSEGVTHGDLKAMNVLIDDSGTARITDFGLSRILSERGFTTEDVGGSVRWMAPELLIPPKCADGSEELCVTFASDVWALAMTVIEIYTGRLPFCHLRQDAWVITDILMHGGRPTSVSCPEVPQPVWDLLERCWAHRPQDRPSIAEVRTTFGAITSPGF